MGKRLHSVDAMRLVAIAFVVIIHTNPFEGLGVYGNLGNFLIETTARFAVPFFFVAAGYFFAKKVSQGNPTGYFLGRVWIISSIYVFGILVTAPAYLASSVLKAGLHGENVIDNLTSQLIAFVSPVELFYYGTSVSEIFWFLPALMYSYALLYLFTRFDRTAYLLPIALTVHLIGLLGSSYAVFGPLPVETRDPLFFGFFYTALGYFLARWDWRPHPDHSTRYLFVTVFFFGFHVGERYLLGYVIGNETFATGVFSPSYTVGTALVTVSLFVFLLSRPRLGAGTVLPTWGRKYAVGIFVVHPVVLTGLDQARSVLAISGYHLETTIAWHLVYSPATFFGAFLLYLAATRFEIVEIGGSHFPQVPSVRFLESRQQSVDR